MTRVNTMRVCAHIGTPHTPLFEDWFAMRLAKARRTRPCGMDSEHAGFFALGRFKRTTTINFYSSIVEIAEVSRKWMKEGKLSSDRANPSYWSLVTHQLSQAPSHHW